MIASYTGSWSKKLLTAQRCSPFSVSGHQMGILKHLIRRKRGSLRHTFRLLVKIWQTIFLSVARRVVIFTLTALLRALSTFPYCIAMYRKKKMKENRGCESYNVSLRLLKNAGKELIPLLLFTLRVPHKIQSLLRGKTLKFPPCSRRMMKLTNKNIDQFPYYEFQENKLNKLLPPQ